MTPRTVALVTGTRAEWGLLRTVAHAVEAHPRLTLRLIAAGTHLITGSRVDLDLPVAAEVPMQRAGEVGRGADAAALGRGVSGFAAAFARLNPCFVVVLGDRIEAFAAAAAASVAGHRVAHLHGGDRAEGVADEAMRHAITKLAHVHLPATATSRRRVLALGEPEAAVHVVGSPAVDGLDAIPAAAEGPEVVVLQHPVGGTDAQEERRMAATLGATAGLRRVVLLPNHDPGRAGVAAAIARHADPAEVVEHLPRPAFIGLLKRARLLVGNSSAGLIEAAACRCAAVDVGPRQAGRERPAHARHADHAEAAIREAMAHARAFDFNGFAHPYGDGRTGGRVADLLADVPLHRIPLRKHCTF
ncbi:UDP-N-acetylglucosamine 2-epimerase [Phycisphaera mikurensis]|uniref:Putative UDP-N-acetylglucosamine 2-epimerase n=1 Tax=Phycisphaera mikurensis (strain NBRC 102666 / KCTC 22515 / FYK2301M01) TaxID=1142394 RepID=I0IB84_PHYMF|nr:UDP-N-acetylglucosamine 2-epimerase [Phycisphaera mikurensis]MBB6443020.1 UDP-hydrolyzing UDP-N-acetyl-D-glucosamine 2-epimerase [Phycisphaera mikurensis]BAM02522.1 putative UDP-N-acetylglucosamine 2-epimerase [Phycisphaera mikurensis NBRC 102666]